jgi:hypothetical protein
VSVRFGLAPMCPFLRPLTIVLLLLPVVFVVAGVAGPHALLLAALVLLLTYGWIWSRFRPTTFVVHADSLEVIWPLKRVRIPRDGISSVRQVGRQELRRAVGWGMRVGAGGLWGGFGWLWTSRRGIVQMYVSRLDRFVWIERGKERPWLITTERTEEFVAALTR